MHYFLVPFGMSRYALQTNDVIYVERWRTIDVICELPRGKAFVSKMAIVCAVNAEKTKCLL